MIQILDSNSNNSNSNKSFLANVTELTNESNLNNKTDDLDFALPLVILSVRLAVIFLMAFLVKKLRVRLLYFLSLFTTLILLVCLALVSDPALIGLTLSDTTLKLIKTVIICLHVFVIQLGVNTLPQLLEITLFPTSCKAAMKGIMRAIISVIMVVFVFLFKTLEYSHTFYLMAAVLLVSSPLLYLYVPEIRNIGSDMAAEFFLPSQTIFYFFPPQLNIKHRNEQAMQRWTSAVKKISAYKAFIIRQVSEETEVDVYSRKHPKVKFADKLNHLEELCDSGLLTKETKERVHFVSNIMSQGNPLIVNPSEQRVLIGKGPIEFQNDFLTGCGPSPSDVIKAGSIFLFNDLLIVATRVISNRRYIREVCFKRQELKTEQLEETLILTDPISDIPKHLKIRFESSELANLWNQYISFS